MGFSENAAKRALMHSQGNVELAMEWILENIENPQLNEPNSIPPQTQKIVERTKMVLVVRTDLNMSVGKIAAQSSHAAVGLVKNMSLPLWLLFQNSFFSSKKSIKE